MLYPGQKEIMENAFSKLDIGSLNLIMCDLYLILPYLVGYDINVVRIT